MHGNGGPSLKLSSQSQHKSEAGPTASFRRAGSNGLAEENLSLQSSPKLASLKDCGTSTEGLQQERVLADVAHGRNCPVINQSAAEDSASDGEQSPLWTRPAHMRNGGSVKKAASDRGVAKVAVTEEGGSECVQVEDLVSSDEAIDKQAIAGSPLARIILTGDSKISQPLVKLAGGGLLKIAVSEDCDLQHNFEIESCAGGKVFETPPIVPGSVYNWRPPGPGKYRCTNQLYPWIKSIITVLPVAAMADQGASTPSEASSESQPSTPDGPLSAAESPVKKVPAKGIKPAPEKEALEAKMAAVRKKGPTANGVGTSGKTAEVVTQKVEVDGGPGSFGVVARTSFPARSDALQSKVLRAEEQGVGNEVDDLLRVPLLAKHPKNRKAGGDAKKPLSDGQTWNESWGDSSADEAERGEAPGCGLRRRAKEEDGVRESRAELSDETDASLQMRQIIQPGDIDEWVERISREEEESRNARAQEPPSGNAPEAASEWTGESESRKGGKGNKKKKRKGGKKEAGAKEAQAAEGAAKRADPETLKPSEEDNQAALLDDPIIGINNLLSSLPSTTGITHYDVSNAGMAKGRPAKLMAIGRSPDGKMEVSPISPMMSPSSLMKGGLSNSKFSDRSSLMDDDPTPYRRLEDIMDLESGLGYIEGGEQTRIREIKNLAGARPHLAGIRLQEASSGWPLGGPHMSPLVPELPCRQKHCQKKFVSSVSMLRHYLQRHKKQGGDLTAERPAMMAFWGELTKEEQRELLSVKDVVIMGVKGDAISAELVQKARFRKMHGMGKGAKYMVLGERLLNMVFSPLELPPTSPEDLFNALDEASEYTFLRGRTDLLVQRVCISSRNLGDEGYLVGILAFMLEDRLVAAWMRSKEEGALRNHRALIEEEEAAQIKRQKAQQKKERKKQKKVAEQPKEPAKAAPAGDKDPGLPNLEASQATPEQVAQPTNSVELDSSGQDAVGRSEEAELKQELDSVYRDGGSDQEPLSTSEKAALDSELDRIIGEIQKQGGGSYSLDGGALSGQVELSLVQEGEVAASLEIVPSRVDVQSGSDTVSNEAEEAAITVWKAEEGSTSGQSEEGDFLSAEENQSPEPAEDGADAPLDADSPAEASLPAAQPVSASADNSTDDSSTPPASPAEPRLRSQESGSGPSSEERKGAKSALAVPVSRMGGKPKAAEPPKGLPVSGAPRAVPGETLVLVTRMGPRAREGGGKGRLEAAKQGSAGSNVAWENGVLLKSDSGDGSKSGLAGDMARGAEVVSDGGKGQVVPPEVGKWEEADKSGGGKTIEDVRAGTGAKMLSGAKDAFKGLQAVVDGKVDIAAGQNAAKSDDAVCVQEKEAGAVETGGLAAFSGPREDSGLQGESAHRGKQGLSRKREAVGSGSVKADEKSVVDLEGQIGVLGVNESVAAESGGVSDLQRKQSAGEPKPSRRARKSKGKKRDGAGCAAQVKDVAPAGLAEAKGMEEAEWTKKATQELKSLLMGSEVSELAAVAPKAEAVSEISYPAEMGTAPVESTPPGSANAGAVGSAGKEAEGNDGTLVEGSAGLGIGYAEGFEDVGGAHAEGLEDVGGAHKSQGWAGVVAAAAQQEAAMRAALEGRKKRQQRLEEEEPKEAWPQLGPVVKRRAPAGKKKQGQRSETESAAGPLRDEIQKGPEKGKTQRGARNKVANGEQLEKSEVGVSANEGQQLREGSKEAGSVEERSEKRGNVPSKNERGVAGKEALGNASGSVGGARKERGLQGPGGMGPEEITAFFAARWHAAVNDPEALHLHPAQSSRVSKEGADLGDHDNPKVESVEPTGWGPPAGPSGTSISRDYDTGARSSASEHANQGFEAQGASVDSWIKSVQDDGGWQEARTRRGGDARGRGRESKEHFRDGGGIYGNGRGGQQRRTEAK